MQIEDLTYDQKVVLDVVYRAGDSKKIARMSKVKFEKILFLLSKRYPQKLEFINSSFDAYAMGAYSEYIDDVLDSLSDYGLIQDHKELTDLGKKIVTQILAKEPTLKEIDHTLNEFLDFASSITDEDFLYIVYNLFPDYASKSYIKERVHSNRFESFRIDLGTNDKTSKNIIEITSDKGNTIKVKLEDDILKIVDLGE